MAFNAQNLLDRDPPSMNISGCDPQMSNLIARLVGISRDALWQVPDA